LNDDVYVTGKQLKGEFSDQTLEVLYWRNGIEYPVTDPSGSGGWTNSVFITENYQRKKEKRRRNLANLTPDYCRENDTGPEKKVTSKTDELKETFPLKGYLICPNCSRKLRGSYSKGRAKRYPYYHCSGNCKTRIRASLVNESYNQQLQQLVLSESGAELFSLVLADTNTLLNKTKFVNDRKTLLRQLEEQESLISKARKLFVDEQLKFDDFRELKKEYQNMSDILKKEFNSVIDKLKHIDQQIANARKSIEDVFHVYQFMDVADKKQILSLIPPAEINIQTGDVAIQMNSALVKILRHK
jgi:hypothetical protein